MNARTFTWILTAISLFLQSSAPAARAGENPLREPLSAVAAAIAKVAGSRHFESVTIGDFDSKTTYGVSISSGIRKTLAEELKKLNINERSTAAPLGVRGSYIITDETDAADAPKDGKSQKSSRLRINFEITDRNGKPLSDIPSDFAYNATQDKSNKEDAPRFHQDAKSIEAVVLGTGATVDFVAKLAAGVSQDDAVSDSFDHPTAYLRNGTAAQASRTSPYYVQMMVRSQPRRLRLEDGQPYVDLSQKEEFQLLLGNDSNDDAGFTVTLDGVNSFAFSEMRKTFGVERGEPKYSRWIVPAHGTFLLKGWHKTNSNVFKFVGTDFGHSAAAEMGSTVNLGAITVTVREVEAKPPVEDGPSTGRNFGSLAGSSGPGGGNTLGSSGPGRGSSGATFGSAAPGRGSSGPTVSGSGPVFIGRGNESSQNVNDEGFTRQVGRTLAMITIRYSH